jgi:hypothetical protein
MTTQGPRNSGRPSRRTVLAAGAAALTTATAGCSQVGKFLADKITGDVNVINYTDRKITGTIEVVGPAGDSLLDESFELAAKTEENESETNSSSDQGNTTSSEDDTAQTIVPYKDVWTESGSYDVTVTFDDVEIDGTSQATETVTIENADKEKLGIFIDTGPPEEVIEFYVESSSTDLLGKKEE